MCKVTDTGNGFTQHSKNIISDLGKSTAGKRHINPLQIVKEKDKWSIHHPAVTQLINKIAEKFRILGLQTTVGLSVQTATG